MGHSIKKAFITGVTGQDGSYLAELLLHKGYEVHAIQRRHSELATRRIDSILFHERFHTHYGDLTDSSNLHRLLSKIEPDEIYNLGAQSHVAVSFQVPEYSAEVDALGTLRLLDAIRDLGIGPRFYQASTSELYGGLPDTVPQNEETPFHPRSPYGVAKQFAHWMTLNYRDAYGLFACNGILFNHESPRRGRTFVTKKITQGVARIAQGRQDRLKLGNLDAKRDWGYAPEYVEAMWRMLQQDAPDDYVIATGRQNTVREFAELAFQEVGISLEWLGHGAEERGLDSNSGRCVVEVDPTYYRPLEVHSLCGDASKAQKELGWFPTVDLRGLVHTMVQYDLRYDDYGHPERKLPEILGGVA